MRSSLNQRIAGGKREVETIQIDVNEPRRASGPDSGFEDATPTPDRCGDDPPILGPRDALDTPSRREFERISPDFLTPVLTWDENWPNAGEKGWSSGSSRVRVRV